MNSKRKREATAILSWRPLHNRAAGGLLKVPGFVGTRSTDFVCKIALSATLFPKTGVLRGGAPKLIFAYFCSVTKVGPRRVGTFLDQKDRRNWTQATKAGPTEGAGSPFPAHPSEKPKAPGDVLQGPCLTGIQLALVSQ